MAVRKFTEGDSRLRRRDRPRRPDVDVGWRLLAVRLVAERFVRGAMMFTLTVQVPLPKNSDFDHNGNDHSRDKEQEQADGGYADDVDNVFGSGSCTLANKTRVTKGW